MRMTLFVGVAVLIDLLAYGAQACMYGPPYATVCEKYASSSAIVTAKVLAVRSGGLGQRVKLQIETIYKGSAKGQIELSQPLSTCDWDFSDEVGKTFLLYLATNKDRRTYHAIGTGYGGAVAEQTDDLTWLAGLPGSLKRIVYLA